MPYDLRKPSSGAGRTASSDLRILANLGGGFIVTIRDNKKSHLINKFKLKL